MKKKSASRSAFFNVRVLIGLFVVLAGIFLALIGLGTFSGLTASSAQAQQKPKIIDVAGLPPGFDCAQIRALGINRQENLRAGLIMIACGESEGGSPLNYGALLFNRVTAPLAYGGTDVDLITGTDSIQHPTQSETYTNANPDNPNQIVVTYNDSRTAGANYSGASYSSDGGTTFTRLNPSPFASGHGTNFGDPVTLYNKPTGAFFAIFLATGCGGQGIAAWTSTDGGVTWAVGACIHTGSSDDRESGWADNNPSSPFFGRMYVSWNNFADGGSLRVRFSTDNGATWTNERQLAPASPFIRDTQITGDPATGTVYVAGMNEGPNGGLAGPRANKIYRSTDGGNTWTNTYTGPNFTPAGRANCTANSYFVCMYAPNTWRHMGWGEPAALNGIVSYVYTQHGAGADPADAMYIRSTDSGVTFAAPFKLNTDSTTRAQWQPNLSVTADGSLFSVWYDERETTSCQVGNPAVPCYRMWARKSTDNGASWLPDMEFSDEISPLPAQPDGAVQPNYQGDYDYGTAIGNRHLTSWVDGRVIISGQSQQDAFFDKEPAEAGTPSPTPTASPSATATATATPTATPALCSWAAGPSMPSPGTRMVGVFFPGNGKFYAMGGRAFDGGGGEFVNPFEYDPATNTWTTKSATYPDNRVNNMACGVLNNAGTDYIYCVGGSESATSTVTGRVFRYDPIADTISTVPANWPSGDANILPGGFSVSNNNMFILGGFNVNVSMDDNIWQFDPGAPAWTHKNAHLPTQLGYIPQATIGSLIYTGGGSTWDGTTLHDSTISLVYDPVADTIDNIAAIPRATAETRGLNFCNTMYVMGGGRDAPNPSNEVDIYDPVANSWSLGTPFAEARRNFPTDTDGTNHIWLSGGYGTDGVTVLDSMEIFTCPVSPCASASPTPTATATATATATPTATATFTPTPTATPRPTPTPRFAPTPRPRPTPAPRP